MDMQARLEDLLVRLPSLFGALCQSSGSSSSSQIKQDLFVLAALGETCGYFVDIGAGNGVTMSNTYMLEKVRGWHGLLVEPARCWQGALRQTRALGNIIDDRAAWCRSGERVMFTEMLDSHLSTISQFQEHDGHAFVRQATVAGRYEVDTVSLNDLLDGHKAPMVVDYLSLDTEGSESDILSAVNFKAHTFRTITVEHNSTSSRDEIYSLLTKNGYRRVLTEFSAFDDWYLGPTI